MHSKYSRKCLFVFYLFGQNSYDLPANTKCKRWLQHIPRIVYIAIAVGGIYRHCEIEQLQERQMPLVMYIVLAVAFAINALVVLEYFTVPNGMQKLITAYKEATDYLERTLHAQVDYERFRRSFQCKVHMIVWTCLMTFCVKIVFVVVGAMPSSDIILFLLYYLRHFASTHILFHTEFVHFLLQTINEINSVDTMHHERECDFLIKTIRPQNVVLLRSLAHCKRAHFRVWKIIQILNVRFGWILIALMLATLLDISYSCYWIWVFLHSATLECVELHRLIRKYFVRFFLLLNCVDVTRNGHWFILISIQL